MLRGPFGPPASIAVWSQFPSLPRVCSTAPAPMSICLPHVEASVLLYDTPNNQGLRCIAPTTSQACICIYIGHEQESR